MTDIHYSLELEKLLKQNAEECESFSILHRMSYEKYNKYSNCINLPVIALSSAVGFLTGIDIQYDKMNIILGIVSVSVGVVKSVDSYFQLAKRAEGHRLCSLQFAQINKKIQIELSLRRDERINPIEMLNEIKINIKNLHDIAPLIDQKIIKTFNCKYDKYTNVSKPSIINGLTEIKIATEEATPVGSVSGGLVFEPKNIIMQKNDDADNSVQLM